MNNHLLIVFGKPGSGKSYAAEILTHSFGFVAHDGDDDIPPRMKQALMKKAEITDDMRMSFLANMIASVNKFSLRHNRLVLHQTLLKEYMRDAIHNAFPEAKFILVETDDTIREQRYLKRKYFNLGLAYLRHMSALFDPVNQPHTVILNNEDGVEGIRKQLIRDNPSVFYSCWDV
jgi:gluconate kinase